MFSKRKKIIIAMMLISWLTIFKYFTIIPEIDWDTHEVTGFEFKVKFWIGRGS